MKKSPCPECRGKLGGCEVCGGTGRVTVYEKHESGWEEWTDGDPKEYCDESLRLNPSVMSVAEGRQLIQAIRAFEEGKEQPEGRFVITAELSEHIEFIKDGCSTRVDEIWIRPKATDSTATAQ